MNVRAVLAVLGFILVIVGILMGAALPFSYWFGGEDALAIIVSLAITLAAGSTLWFIGREQRHDVGKREGPRLGDQLHGG